AQSVVDQQAGGSGSPESTSSVIWTPPVVSLATVAPSVVPRAIATLRELDAPAANSDALIWCAASSTSEALLAAPISRRYFFCARASSLLDPYASWHSLEGEVVEFLKWKKGPPIMCPQQARQKGPQTPAP
ncbi:hypothetical protein EJD97_022630, partial [Solanum chilense]